MTAAQIEAACIAIQGDGGALVECEHGSVPLSLGVDSERGPTFDVSDGRFLLRVPNGLRILVEDGAHITIDRPDHLTAHDELLWLFGSAWGALAYQRGLLPLHMSAIELPDGGICGFGGASGAGKSTLAAALQQRGHTLFADDVTAITLASDGKSAPARPLALPGHKTLKLWGDAVDRLGVETDRRVRDDKPLDKFYVAGDDSSPRSAAPLARLYMLSDRHGVPDDEPSMLIEQRTGMSAVAALDTSIYRRQFGEFIVGRRRLFEMLARLVEQVPVYTFGRPRRTSLFDQGVDLLEGHLAETGDG